MPPICIDLQIHAFIHLMEHLRYMLLCYASCRQMIRSISVLSLCVSRTGLCPKAVVGLFKLCPSNMLSMANIHMSHYY